MKTLKRTCNRHLCTVKLCRRESLGVLEKTEESLSGTANIIDIRFHLVPPLTCFYVLVYSRIGNNYI